jgi:hypothetical protein
MSSWNYSSDKERFAGERWLEAERKDTSVIYITGLLSCFPALDSYDCSSLSYQYIILHNEVCCVTTNSMGAGPALVHTSQCP